MSKKPKTPTTTETMQGQAEVLAALAPHDVASTVIVGGEEVPHDPYLDGILAKAAGTESATVAANPPPEYFEVTLPKSPVRMASNKVVRVDPPSVFDPRADLWAVVARVPYSDVQTKYVLAGPHDLQAIVMVTTGTDPRAWVHFERRVQGSFDPSKGHARAEASRLAADAYEYIGEAEIGTVDATDVHVDIASLASRCEVTLNGEDGIAIALAYFGL